jgi:hypothetical protein
MYAFERAYVDYVGGLQRAARRVWDTCKHIWEWFWQGPGARTIESLLQLAIVIAAIVAGYLFVRFEIAHGRSFSWGMAINLVGIATFVAMILWGWKALVHLIARVISSTTASAVLLAVSVIAILLTIAFFVPWLLALFVLTALSFVVFLPMRGIYALWLLKRKITYQCPYDDDDYNGPPIHVCSCGHRYTDLYPNFYGVFHHTCRANGHKARLPTLDFLGRNKLDRLCGHCERPLTFSSLGELAVRPIGVVGGPSAGKTVFLRQATRELIDTLNAQSGSKVQFESSDQEAELRADWVRLDQGEVLPKTSGDIFKALAVAAKLSKKQRYLLYLFDAPGEQFGKMEHFGRKLWFQNPAGIILFVDPYSLPQLADHAMRARPELKASDISFHQIKSTLIGGVNMMLVKQPTDECRVPLAVVLGKADSLPVGSFPSLTDLIDGSSTLSGTARSDRCRQALIDLGATNDVLDLERKFSTVRYFACSALGRMPDPRNTRAFQPIGVIEPFLWFMEHWAHPTNSS